MRVKIKGYKSPSSKMLGFLFSKKVIFTVCSYVNDYYPFGSLIPNRHGSSSAYRYGFNGKEKDDEIMGEGNFEDYGMRMYNPRLGRFFNNDPLTKHFPWYSPYQFAGNTPIAAIDLDGEEPKIVITDNVTGYTRAYIYGVDKNHLVEMVVKTYEAKVLYTNSKGEDIELGSFNVTRDGFFDHGTASNGARLLINHASDPIDDAKLFIEKKYPEKYGKGAPAFVISKINSPLLDKYNGKIYKLGKIINSFIGEAKRDGNFAEDTMFHIGGIYYPITGPLTLGGTFGCYGIVDPQQVQKIDKPEDYVFEPAVPSNAEMSRFGTAIENAQKLQIEEHKTEAKTEVIINKREYEKVKKVFKPKPTPAKTN